MSAMPTTRRPLIKNVGVWLTSSDCPNSIDFLTLASVPAAAAQEAIFSASRPAAVASSFSLSSAVASAMLPWVSKMAARDFQKHAGVPRPAQSVYLAAFLAPGCRDAGGG